MAAASPLLAQAPVVPSYRIVTKFQTAQNPGMPGKYRGRVIRVHSERAIDAFSNRVDGAVVQKMLSAGMCELTGASDDRGAWAHFFSPTDVVGIKVNCSGAPEINSNPELVAAIIGNLLAAGLPPKTSTYTTDSTTR